MLKTTIFTHQAKMMKNLKLNFFQFKFQKNMYTSITKIYGDWFEGAAVGRRSVTSETMKDEATVTAILKIGFFWQMNRAGLTKSGNYKVWPFEKNIRKRVTNNWGGHSSLG